MTKVQCEELLFAIQEAYPGRVRFTDEAIDLWHEQLSDIPVAILAAAVKELIRSSEFPPAISEIRKACARMVSPLPSVEDAYHEARDAASRLWTPPNGPIPPMSHPLIARALDVVGIDTMGMSHDPEIVGAQFRRVYENLRERELVRRQRSQGAIAALVAAESMHQLPERGVLVP